MAHPLLSSIVYLTGRTFPKRLGEKPNLCLPSLRAGSQPSQNKFVPSRCSAALVPSTAFSRLAIWHGSNGTPTYIFSNLLLPCAYS